MSGQTLLQGISLNAEDPVMDLFQQVQEARSERCSHTLVSPAGDAIPRRGTVRESGVRDGDELLAIATNPRPPPIEPRKRFCTCRFTQDVSIGAQHEGWGRSWKTCSYDCVVCGHAVYPGESADVCHGCRAFRHARCRPGATGVH
jgi:hypothetical protein